MQPAIIISLTLKLLLSCSYLIFRLYSEIKVCYCLMKPLFADNDLIIALL